MNRQTPMLSEDDVRETPPELFDPLNEKIRFTIDIAASHGNAKCEIYCTEEGLFNGRCGIRLSEYVDGLSAPLTNERVWCNPPFSKMPIWVARAWKATEAESIHMLAPATRTEQRWWQRMVEPYRDGRKSFNGWSLRTQFLDKRINFLKGGKPIINPTTGNRSQPKFGCVLLIWEHK